MKTNADIAKNILHHIMKFRRIIKKKNICSELCCKCHAPHLQKIVSSIQKDKAISFVLPAFPGKSPNKTKVLGFLPDMGEQLALGFLQKMCHQIKKIYKPGAEIILCSDGRVFSDIIGMEENYVTAYREKLEEMIKSFNFSNLSIFTLEYVYDGENFHQMRHHLMEKYSEPLESLKEKVRRGSLNAAIQEDQEEHRMYCGITRFLFEDAMFPEQQRSRNAIQKESKLKAYELIRRSHAWSALIEEYFPHAVRLSIHPQMCGSRKLGVRLIGAEDWMTPWHGVALETVHGFVLVKRHEAEKLGARLVHDSNGRASHYSLKSKNIMKIDKEVF